MRCCQETLIMNGRDRMRVHGRKKVSIMWIRK